MVKSSRRNSISFSVSNESINSPLLHRRQGRGAIVLHVDDVDQASQILAAADFRMITEGDLLEDDEFL
jgi:hypothetical protein